MPTTTATPAHHTWATITGPHETYRGPYRSAAVASPPFVLVPPPARTVCNDNIAAVTGLGVALAIISAALIGFLMYEFLHYRPTAARKHKKAVDRAVAAALAAVPRVRVQAPMAPPPSYDEKRGPKFFTDDKDPV